VAWELSADAGTSWTTFAPNGSWSRIVAPGYDLVWRTAHTWSPDASPTVSDLTLEWLNEFGPITSITDMPEDQGGRVDLSFGRSGYDFSDEAALPVVGYAIYQRVDDPGQRRRVLTEGMQPSIGDLDDSPLASYGVDRIRFLEDRGFVLGGDRTEPGEFPPGVWQGVGWVLPTQSDEYSTWVYTPADSTSDGIAWTVFLTAVHTTTPEIWFASQPDSGYSVDNIPPGAPDNFRVDYDYYAGNALSWDESEEADFDHFKLYRGDSEDFEPGQENLVHQTATTSWSDAEGGVGHFYKITTVDFAGNEGSWGAPLLVTGNPVTPTHFALHQNSPNPFNPTTEIRFDLATASTRVSLTIFDTTGRLVRVARRTHGGGQSPCHVARTR
jgi:hypothetical protein